MKILDFGLVKVNGMNSLDIKHYIFITSEGFTFQPNSESDLSEIENMQVIGFGKGVSPKTAFNNMIKDNFDIQETTFDEVYCYRLHSEKIENVFSIKDIKPIS